MAVNKVVYNTENGAETLIDLTSDTVTPETLAEGAVAHDASGNIITGIGKTTSVLYTEQELTEEQKEQARKNIGVDITKAISPTVEVTSITNGHRVSITDAEGTETFDVLNGSSGKDGSDGKDGIDGKDGTSVVVASVSESSTDGGSNVVTFSDGKTLTIKNGSRGSSGKDGSNGKDGTSVTVTKVSESSADGGSNVVTFSDGKTLTVKNGSAGSAGKDGKDGADGKDYVLTDADKEEIASLVPSGGGGGSAIIDVIALPDTDINEDAFYRLLTANITLGKMVATNYTCHCVETLPETGEACLAGDLSDVESLLVTAYYNVADGSAYGYIDDMLSGALGIPSAWYPVDMLFGNFGFTYGGVISNLAEAEDDTVYILLEYVVYSYKDGWSSLKPIGKAGTGIGAEIFNYVGNIASGITSHAEGYYANAVGNCSHSEGSGTTASGDYSHSEGAMTTASGDYSHSEGDATTASGEASHAEGMLTTASGNYSHSEGYETTASGNCSHSEGLGTIASGNYSHSEGYETTASGKNSHSEGTGTIASSENQHVQGKYNIEDAEDRYAHIVGNGINTERSNAHTLDWYGTGWFAGDVKVGGTGQDDPNAKTLATTEYVDSKSGGGGASIDVTAEVGQTIIVKEVDANGKPTKWESAEYQPRTHWSEVEEFVSERVLSVEDEDFDGSWNMLIDKPFVVGNTYIVNWNGVEYNCVALSVAGEVGIGNVALALGTGDTGEPFIMACGEEDGVIIAMLMSLTEDTEITFSVKAEVVTPIPSTYVANALPYYIRIRGTGTDDDPFVCNDTVEKVNAIFNSGRPLMVSYNDGVGFTWRVPLIMEAQGNGRTMYCFCAMYSSNTLSRFVLISENDGTFKVSNDL